MHKRGSKHVFCNAKTLLYFLIFFNQLELNFKPNLNVLCVTHNCKSIIKSLNNSITFMVCVLEGIFSCTTLTLRFGL